MGRKPAAGVGPYSPDSERRSWSRRSDVGASAEASAPAGAEAEAEAEAEAKTEAEAEAEPPLKSLSAVNTSSNAKEPGVASASLCACCASPDSSAPLCPPGRRGRRGRRCLLLRRGRRGHYDRRGRRLLRRGRAGTWRYDSVLRFISSSPLGWVLVLE